MNLPFVGWVERSDTHRPYKLMMGIALLNPSYPLRQKEK
jgi:hypothetical protein